MANQQMSQPSNASDEELLVEHRGTSLWLRINRPHAKNAITPNIISRMTSVLEATRRDRELRVVVIASEGEDFSAGADLKDVQASLEPFIDGGPTAQQKLLQDVQILYGIVETFPRPVIASVRGLALAGGLELILCCDVVIASKTAKFGDAHSNYGFIPGGGGSVRLPRRVGVSLAKHMMFSGLILPVRDFAGNGFITEISEDHELETRVEEYVALLSRKSPVGLERMKYLLNSTSDLSVEEGLALEQKVSSEHEQSSDFREGLTAFIEKRYPKFKGN